MSEPAAFALIRDGKTRYFADRWASALLRREVMWGPQDFAAWVEQFEELDEWALDCDGGAVVDYDNRLLLWEGAASEYRVPRVRRLYNRLLAAAWQEFKVELAPAGSDRLAKHVGIIDEPRDHADGELPDDEDEEDNDYEPRPQTVEESRRYEPDEDDGPDEDDDDVPRAWVTIVDAEGSSRHRQLDELPLDLLQGEPGALESVAKLKPAQIPPEAVVSEGLFLNTKEHIAFLWGSPELRERMKELGRRWRGWTLRWSKQGYAQQCAASGVAGQPMTDADALARILPLVLSTEQFNLGTVIGAIGGGVQKFARKATGCLIVVLCLPLLLFGVFSGAWMSVLYAVVATVVVVSGLYMLIVRRVRRSFAQKMQPLQGDGGAPTVVAGPQDEQERKVRIDRLLALAGLPPLAEVQPLFPNATGLELLAEQ